MTTEKDLLPGGEWRQGGERDACTGGAQGIFRALKQCYLIL